MKCLEQMDVPKSTDGIWMGLVLVKSSFKVLLAFFILFMLFLFLIASESLSILCPLFTEAVGSVWLVLEYTMVHLWCIHGASMVHL